MATKPGKWEVVGKPSKIPKKKELNNGTKSKKPDLSAMPRIESLDPVKESSTIYDAFAEKEPVTKPARKPVDTNISTIKKNAPKKKIPSSPKPSKKISLEDAVKKIDYDMVQAVLEKDQATFPDNPTVWLMDLATFINCNLDNVPEPDPVFSGKPLDYPLCALPSNIQTLLRGVLEKCSEKTQRAFMEACTKSMVNDMGKGISTYGFRMVIQLLAKMKPEIILKDIPKYVALVKENQSRHGRCLAVLWATGQGGQRSLHSGLTVWFDLMMPFLNTRSVAGYIVDYLATLFKVHGSKGNANIEIACKQFFPLLDLTFNAPSYLSGPLQKKLQALYPEVKKYSLKKSTNSYRIFFPSFLARLTPGCKPAMKKEICACIVECLKQDPQCYSVWRQMYANHQTQSCELVKQLSSEWATVSKVLDTRSLKETVDTFCRTNQDLEKQGKANKELVVACKELQLKMGSKSRTWLLLPVMFICTLMALLAYDVHLHSSFKNSATRRVLSNYGVLNILNNAWAKTNMYTATATLWLQNNVPHYYNKAAEVVEPYLALFWQKLYALLLYLAEVSAPYRAKVAEVAVTYLQWINTQLPWISELLKQYATIAWTYTSRYALLAWQSLQYYSLIAGTWLQANVFTGKMSIENLSAMLTQAVQALQGYLLAAVRYLSGLVSA